MGANGMDVGVKKERVIDMGYLEAIEKSRVELFNSLNKPNPPSSRDIGCSDYFDPWEDIIHGIYGNYNKACDDMMIETLEAIRDGKTFELIAKDFSYELMLYIFAGHGLTDYGGSPRGGWFTHKELLQPLIDKWKHYSSIAWES